MFMRWLSFPIIALFVLQCGGDQSVREQAKAEVEQLAKASASKAEASPVPAANTDNPSSNATVNETLTLVMGSAEVKAGEQVCLPITATGFTNLIGLQFSIRWERDQLEYVKVDNLKLTDLGPQNFGDTHAELGVVALSWIHQNLQGVSLPASAPVFDICFIPKTEAGSKVDVRFEARPVAFEVIDTQENLLKFAGVNGQITVVE